jgi:predicted Zn-dependent peptidase
VAQESLFELLFDVHRMRRWRIGTEDMLSGFTRDDVWLLPRLYRPSKHRARIVGDVEAGPPSRAVERHYGDWPAA